jgi:hypothetical protein
VPSSISSSSRAIPDGNWRATWVVAGALAIAAVAWSEQLSRAHGQRPSVTDDPVGWAVARRSADGDPKVVAFVGTSRMELAYSANAFAEAVPGRRGVQLALNGAPADRVLRDLADDDEFRGLAIIDIDEWDIAYGDFQALSQPFIDRAHALWRAPGAVANHYLARVPQEDLAVLAVGGRAIVTTVFGKLKWPTGRAIVSEADRTSHGNYALVDPRSLEKTKTWRIGKFSEPTPTPAAWLASAAALDPLVQRIRAHGGEVVFVRMPVSGALAAGFARDYPRATYWDAFAAHSSAHVIHYLDVPGLAALSCPDEMHIDQTDQRAFMQALIGALHTRGVL